MTAEEMIERYKLEAVPSTLAELLHCYGAQVREECAKVAEYSSGEPYTSENIRTLELP